MSVLEVEALPSDSAIRDMPKGPPAGPTMKELPEGVEPPKMKFTEPPPQAVYE